jgi:hypothetical protein
VIGGFTIDFYTDRFTLNPSITYSSMTQQYTPIGYIPEFPSWTPSIVTLVAFLVMRVICYRQKLSQRREEH